MLKLLAMAALLGAPATPAPPSAPRCLTRQQVGDMTVVSMAVMVETVRNACRSHLPATAYLATPAAAEFSTRLRREALQRIDSAVAGVTSIGGPSALPPRAIENFRADILKEGVGAELAAFANPELCGDANEIIEISSTLSPDQMGRLFGAFASLVDHVIRMIPPELLGPNGHPPVLPPMPSAPPAATPTPTPAALFDVQPRARRPAPTPAPEATPSPPRPFICRPGS